MSGLLIKTFAQAATVQAPASLLVQMVGAGTPEMLPFFFTLLCLHITLPKYSYLPATAAKARLLVPMVGARNPEMLLQRSFTLLCVHITYVPLLPYCNGSSGLPADAIG